mgnify:CR=1 FL=1
MIIMLVAMTGILGGLAYLKFRSIQAGIAMGAKFAQLPPTPVTTVVVKSQTWQPVLSAIGETVALGACLSLVFSAVLFGRHASAAIAQEHA